MSLVLNVEILGEFKKLTAATQGAQGTLQGLDNRIGSFASSAKKAFASIGVGLSFAFIANELKEATKAAIEDRKSQELLATAMENTGNATAESVKQAEKFIGSMQDQVAIADDELRPAYQKLFIATGDVTKSNQLLKIALDASAGTGKSLDTVAQAMAKSLAGNDTALTKLIPSLKGSKTPIDDLAASFNGAAEAAANLDPYQQFQTKWEDIQEQIGTALLPVLDQLATWLKSPKGEETVQKVTDAIKALVEKLGEAATWVAENGDWLVPLATGLGTITAAWKLLSGAINGTKAAIDLARKAQELFNKTPQLPGATVPTAATPATTASKAGKVLSGAAQWVPFIGSAIAGFAGWSDTNFVKSVGANATPWWEKTPKNPIIPVPKSTTTNVTINNNTGTVTGSDITSLLKKFGSNTGTN